MLRGNILSGSEMDITIEGTFHEMNGSDIIINRFSTVHQYFVYSEDVGVEPYGSESGPIAGG